MNTDLVDQEARRSIREDTARTLFVEAGAGSGKTTMLVQRVQQLTLWDGVPMGEIAAVTFSERAGAELRDRLRDRLEKAAEHGTDETRRARAEAALDELDTAAIGTLHSFAQRILSEHPIEAGIPPLIEVLDEVGSSVAFEGRWLQLRTELLDDPTMSATMDTALASGISLDQVRSLITKLSSDWDLVDERVVAPGRPPEPTLPDLSPLIEQAHRLGAMESFCTCEEDKFLPRLRALDAWADGGSAQPGTTEKLARLTALTGLKWGNGQKANYGDYEGKNDRLEYIRTECKQLQEQGAGLMHGVVEATLRSIVHWCGVRVIQSAETRRTEGRLEFHDLLVIARNLLRENAEVRATLQRRYHRLLLDEFQDTDPIQIEIAVRIAGGAAATQDRWQDVDVPQGSLFVVGDPKQSIYRFRRADIAVYLRAQQMLGGGVSLTTNFRTVAPILGWVNAVFGKLIKAQPDMQPPYQPLDRSRGTPTVGEPVTVLGAVEHPDKLTASRLRELEAADVAQAIVQALDQGWTTEEKAPSSSPDAGAATARRRWRPLRPGDITILIPARTSLPFLETALDDAGLMYRTESSSLVYHAQEVRDLFAAVRAIADPSDAFALVTALRSPLFGCGDDDLWTWKQAAGSFNLLAPAPGDQQDHPVAVAISALRDLYRRSRWLTPSEVLGALAVERRMFEAAVSGPRARDSWRRLRFVIDQARAWSESEHGGLRSYLAWATAQSAEGSRVAESVLPESDVDSVRIMTIHAAKGLEFPMVVVSGLTAQPRRDGGVRLLWSRDGYAVSLSKDLQTGDFQDQVPLDEQMSSYERLRLMYVAATRACDHLVISLHRSGTRDTNARLLADAGGAQAGAVPLPSSQAGSPPARQASPVSPPPDFDTWLAGVRQSAVASRRLPAFSASGLEGTDPDAEGPLPDVEGPLPDISVATDVAITVTRTDDDVASGIAKGGRDVELPAWSKGRYGSSIGRAVHGVLQVVDLASGNGLEAAVAAQCIAEGVVEFAPLVTLFVRSALGSDVVKRAATREHWRESYVGMAQEDGTVLEGFVDLIYREDDRSLVIVDYKTDDARDAALPSRVGCYAPQLNAYRTIVESAVGEPTATPILVFAREAAARSMTVNGHPQ